MFFIFLWLFILRRKFFTQQLEKHIKIYQVQMGTIEFSNVNLMEKNLIELHNSTKESASHNLKLSLQELGCDSDDYNDYAVQLENVRIYKH